MMRLSCNMLAYNRSMLFTSTATKYSVRFLCTREKNCLSYSSREYEGKCFIGLPVVKFKRRYYQKWHSLMIIKSDTHQLPHNMSHSTIIKNIACYIQVFLKDEHRMDPTLQSPSAYHHFPSSSRSLLNYYLQSMYSGTPVLTKYYW